MARKFGSIILNCAMRESCAKIGIMLNELKLRETKYKILKDGSYFGEIPGLPGIWAASRNLQDCRMELREVVEDWLFLKVRDREPVPGFKIRTDQREPVKRA